MEHKAIFGYEEEKEALDAMMELAGVKYDPNLLHEIREALLAYS